MLRHILNLRKCFGIYSVYSSMLPGNNYRITLQAKRFFAAKVCKFRSQRKVFQTRTYMCACAPTVPSQMKRLVKAPKPSQSNNSKQPVSLTSVQAREAYSCSQGQYHVRHLQTTAAGAASGSLSLQERDSSLENVYKCKRSRGSLETNNPTLPSPRILRDHQY